MIPHPSARSYLTTFRHSLHLASVLCRTRDLNDGRQLGRVLGRLLCVWLLGGLHLVVFMMTLLSP